MKNTIIQVEGIGKCYRLGESGGTDSFREALSNTINRFGRRMVGKESGEKNLRDFWAIKDINFNIKQGDVVGIIGHNGSGKSTLLKILSRITDPTEGKANIWGRVGSLLEVGTGFHPELTGRENIYLNGSILGMTTGEIKSKFDEIVDFAEIEQFLETPVKRYSSGMYVRLAFAVAAHLQPEVLIVDEVLAVGDVKFQNKCLGKMKDVASKGRTILFVSHNMAAVQNMCTRGIVLDHGRMRCDTTADEAVSLYLELMSEQATTDLSERTVRGGDGSIKIISVRAMSAGKPDNNIACGDKVLFEIKVDKPCSEMVCTLIIHDIHGQPIMALRNSPHCEHDSIDPSLENTLLCEVDGLNLVPGQYRVDFTLVAKRAVRDSVKAAVTLTVLPGTVGDRIINEGVHHVNVIPPQKWRVPA